MSMHLQKEIEKLKKKILSLCALVEESVEKAVSCVSRRDENLARQVIKADPDVDHMEVEVEEECLKILALHQPVAIDLRYVIAILKINNDMERIGDLAVNIAEQAVFLASRPPVLIPFDFASMVEKTQAMLRNSLDAMVNLNAHAAYQVCISDDEVDAINRAMYGQVQEGIQQHPEEMDLLLRYLTVSRNLERIADYATNIAEDVIYMIEGKIIRHHNL
jgi:phosphate transport system protein